MCIRDSLRPEVIEVIDSASLSAMDASAISGFNGSQTALIQPEAMSGLNGDTFVAFSGNAIGGLTADHVSNLPSDIFTQSDGSPNLSAIEQIAALQPEAVAGLSLEHIDHIPGDALGPWDPIFEAHEGSDIGAVLTADQISNFSSHIVMEHLNSDVIAALSPEAASGISGDVMVSIDPEDMSGFTAEPVSYTHLTLPTILLV